jgi:cell division protein FtsL
MTTRRLKKDKKWALVKFNFCVFVFVCFFGLVWLRVHVVNLEYELGQLESRQAGLIKQGRILSAERANLYSAGKIEKIATKRLGMIFPERERVFFVKKAKGATPYKVSIYTEMKIEDNTSSHKALRKVQRK